MGVLVGERLGMTSISSPQAQHHPGLSQAVWTEGKGEDSALLYSGTMRPHLGYCTQPWGCQHMKNMGLLEQVQRRTLKMIREMEHLFNENRLRQLGLLQSGEDSVIL